MKEIKQTILGGQYLLSSEEASIEDFDLKYRLRPNENGLCNNHLLFCGHANINRYYSET